MYAAFVATILSRDLGTCGSCWQGIHLRKRAMECNRQVDAVAVKKYGLAIACMSTLTEKGYGHVLARFYEHEEEMRYCTAVLLKLCYAPPPPPPIFGRNYCIGCRPPPPPPPRVGLSSRFVVPQFLHVHTCCKCRRVVFVYQACRK